MRRVGQTPWNATRTVSLVTFVSSRAMARSAPTAIPTSTTAQMVVGGTFGVTARIQTTNAIGIAIASQSHDSRNRWSAWKYVTGANASIGGVATKPDVTIPAGAPPDELKVEDLTVGTGAEATAGKTVDVHYVGVSWSTKQQFDASWDRGGTFSFQLGAGRVIKGWDQGVAGMKVGGRRRLTIPARLGYGDRGAGADIKPGETLVFVVDLLGVK
jgi:peptidylprolyl isomerase